MARWGTRITNSATGSVQVDDLYSNMALISKTTITTGTSFMTGGSISTGTITYTATELPLIAFSCGSPAAVYTIARNESANTWTFTFVAEGASRTITCYEFGAPPSLGPGWGARIKSGGTVRYDSRHRYARVSTSLRGTFDTDNNYGKTGPGNTLPTGLTCAVMMGGLTSLSGMIVVPDSGGYHIYDDFAALLISVNSNMIASKYLRLVHNHSYYPVPPSPNPPSTWYLKQQQYSWAILDVTGY